MRKTPSPARFAPALALLGAALALAACGGDGADRGNGPGDDSADPNVSTDSNAELIEQYKEHLEFPDVTYRWNKDAGDPSVPADQGGPGFTGEGWTTRMTFPATGWPDAPQGGTLRGYILDWPATLRLHGENYNTSFNYTVVDLCAEGLLALHPTDLEFIPSLATHWQISDDKQTYRFRINPDARWADGAEVTAADVVATYKLRMDPKCRFPSSIILWQKFEEPVAESKYIVRFKCKQDNWRNFLYAATSVVFPANHISMPGDEFLDKYQNSYFPLSGAYEVKMEDVKLGVSLAITKRKGWWREGDPSVVGTSNIDRFEYEVIKDINLAYEKAKKGELDIYYVPKAQWWATEIGDLEPVKRGLLVMKKIFNDAPIGTNGVAINMKKAPLDDVRIRKALQLLYNRPLMIEKLYFDEYQPLTSYWQGGMYANPDNEEFPYDPMGAVELLEAAGWTEVNDQLLRVKGNRLLEFEILYTSPLSERSLTIFQEDCAKAGVKINLRRITPAEQWKAVTGKEYELSNQNWGALVFPNPESSWKGELAEQTGNNNITAYSNPAVDALLAKYDAAYEVKERVAVMRQLDGLIYKDHPYVLGWYGGNLRFMYWNKIGMPPWGCGRFSQSRAYYYSFWIDPQKEAELAAARKDPTKKMAIPEKHNRFWQAWNAWQRNKGGE